MIDDIADRLSALERRMVTLDDLRRVMLDDDGDLRGSIGARKEIDAIERERKEQEEPCQTKSPAKSAGTRRVVMFSSPTMTGETQGSGDASTTSEAGRTTGGCVSDHAAHHGLAPTRVDTTTTDDGRMTVIDALRHAIVVLKQVESDASNLSLDAMTALRPLEGALQRHEEQNNGEAAGTGGTTTVVRLASRGPHVGTPEPAASLSFRGDPRLDAEPARTWQPEAPPAGAVGTTTNNGDEAAGPARPDQESIGRPSGQIRTTTDAPAASLSLSDAMEALAKALELPTTPSAYRDTMIAAVARNVLAAWDRYGKKLVLYTWHADYERERARADSLAESMIYEKRRADDAEAAERSMTEEIRRLQAERATLAADAARYHGECEMLRDVVARLQAYCQRHELPGLGTFVDECVTAECDRLRAALKVERKSVDEMRNNILYVYESGGVKKASTRVLDRDVYAWCRAVDERRKWEAK